MSCFPAKGSSLLCTHLGRAALQPRPPSLQASPLHLLPCLSASEDLPWDPEPTPSARTLFLKEATPEVPGGHGFWGSTRIQSMKGGSPRPSKFQQLHRVSFDLSRSQRAIPSGSFQRQTELPTRMNFPTIKSCQRVRLGDLWRDQVSITEGWEQETPIWKDSGEALGLGGRWNWLVKKSLVSQLQARTTPSRLGEAWA